MKTVVAGQLFASRHTLKRALQTEVQRAGFVGNLSAVVPEDPSPYEGVSINSSDGATFSSNDQGEGIFLLRVVGDGGGKSPSLQPVGTGAMLGWRGSVWGRNSLRVGDRGNEECSRDLESRTKFHLSPDLSAGRCDANSRLAPRQ